MNAPATIDVETATELGQPARYKLRIQDYLLLHEAGSFRDANTELVDGDIIIMSPEWMPHMRVKDELAYRLRRAIEQLELNLLVGTGGSVQLSEVDQPRPDVIVFSRVDGDKAVPKDAVSLLVEVSSTTLSFDLNDKAPLYAREGIPEYWTVDVAGRIIHQWSSPDRNGFKMHEEVSFGEPITSKFIGGVTISTGDL